MKKNTYLKYTLLTVVAFITIFPVAFMIFNSFFSKDELSSLYGVMASNSKNTGEYMYFKIIPDNFNLIQYYNAFLRTPSFLVMFLNSIILTVPIVIGQLLVSMPAAYAFAKLNFPFKDKIFFIYIVIMLMPYQVTLVPNFIVLRFLGLIGTRASVILPGIFSTFGVFLMTQFIKSIPNEQCEAAQVDGASHFRIFNSIIIPQCKNGIVSLIILCFVDNWNMVEQPLVFLNNENKFPLSVFLSNLNHSQLSIAFACGVIFMVPAILIFLSGENELIEGMKNLEIK